MTINQQFIAVPPIVALDKRMTYRTLRLYLVIALHANRSGVASLSQARIAEMLDLYTTDRATGQRKPHVRAVHEITAELTAFGYLKPSVKNGRVKRQTGFNYVNEYQLTLPSSDDVELPAITDRRESSEQYHARKKAEQQASQLKNPKFSNSVVLPTTDDIDEFTDELASDDFESAEQVANSLLDFHSGSMPLLYTRSAIERAGYEYPAIRCEYITSADQLPLFFS